MLKANLKTITPPDDDAAAFEQVLEYAYWGTISIRTPTLVGDGTGSEDAAEILRITIRAWILANKLILKDLTNTLSNFYRDFHQTYSVVGAELQPLTTEGLSNGKMR